MAMFDAEGITVLQLFEESKLLKVPPYQRSYSWGTEEIETFCQDLKDVKDSGNTGYFFGGIVCVEKKEENGVEVRTIVDGQQRITTFSLLAKKISDTYRILAEKFSEDKELSQHCTEESSDLRDSYLKWKVKGKYPTERVNKLSLSNVDKDFFWKLINSENVTPQCESHNKMMTALQIMQDEFIKEILEMITTDSPQDVVNELGALTNALSTYSNIIYISAEDQEKAYQLFEVLNDRGRNLAVGDYLRSFTLEIVDAKGSKKQFDELVSYWDQILEYRDSDNFLTQYLKANFGSKCSTKKIHQEYKKYFFSNDDEKTSASVHLRVKNIMNNLEVYENLVNGEWPLLYNGGLDDDWKKKRLFWLVKKLEHKPIIPLLMSLVDRKIDENDFAELIHIIEKFYLKFIVIGRGKPSLITPIYSDAINSIRETGKFDLNKFKTSLQVLMDQYITKGVFLEGFIKLEYSGTNSKRNRSIICLLNVLENYWDSYGGDNSKKPYEVDDSLTYVVKKNEIEHIYPQKPYPEDINPEFELVKHRVANLTYLRKKVNSTLQNKPFSIKVEEYKKTKVSMTCDLENYQGWDLEAFSKREKKLMEMAYNVLDIKSEQFITFEK